VDCPFTVGGYGRVVVRAHREVQYPEPDVGLGDARPASRSTHPGRHQVPDDVVWEIAKGFDIIYQQARRQAEASSAGTEAAPLPHRMEPHPGLTYLLKKLEVEAAAQVNDARRE
jgi:hypothetical protein